MKKIAAIALSTIILLSIFSANVFAESGKPSSVSDVTLEQIQDLFNEYIEKSGLQIRVGTHEYYDYIVEQLLEHSDNNLLEVSNYDLIHAYMVEYKVVYDDYLCVEYYLSRDDIDFDVASFISLNSCIEYEKDNGTATFDLSPEFLSMTIGDIIARNEQKTTATDSESKTRSTLLSGYSGSQAASYAIQYASGHNSTFPHYSADCTNFVSQCVYAGGIAMDGSNSSVGTYETTSDWYCIYINSILGIRRYAVTTSWIRVADFKTFMGSLVSTYTKTTLSSLVSSCAVGDVVQLADKTTGTPYHSIIISGKDSSTAYFCGHTNSRNNVNVYDYLDDSSDKFILFDFT